MSVDRLINRRTALKGFAYGAAGAALWALGGCQISEQEVRKTPLTGTFLVEKEINGVQSLYLHDITSGTDSLIDPGRKDGVFHSIAPSPDGNRVAFIEQDNLQNEKSPKPILKIYNIEKKSFENDQYEVPPRAWDISWSADSKRLALDINGDLAIIENNNLNYININREVISQEFHPTEPSRILVDISNSSLPVTQVLKGTRAQWLQAGNKIGFRTAGHNLSNSSTYEIFDEKLGRVVDTFPYDPLKGLIASSDGEHIVYAQWIVDPITQGERSAIELYNEVSPTKVPLPLVKRDVHFYVYNVISGNSHQLDDSIKGVARWIGNERLLVSAAPQSPGIRIVNIVDNSEEPISNFVKDGIVVGYIPPKK